MRNVHMLNAVVADGLYIRYERINEAFMSGQLTYSELSIVFKKWPDFHRWFIKKHKQVFA